MRRPVNEMKAEFLYAISKWFDANCGNVRSTINLVDICIETLFSSDFFNGLFKERTSEAVRKVPLLSIRVECLSCSSKKVETLAMFIAQRSSI